MTVAYVGRIVAAMAKTPNGSGIVSLRLAPEEKKLIEEAAAKKGWKVAHFLRVTALDKAVHIINLSRPTAFDFAGVAKRAADSLRAPRKVKIYDTDPYLLPDPFGEYGEGEVTFRDDERNPPDTEPLLSQAYLKDFSPAPLTTSEVDQLQEAMRLGGEEFFAELLAACRRVAKDPADPSLPPPIDPRNLNGPDKDT